MSIIITDGSPACQTLFLTPCPACGRVFDNAYGVFVNSATLGDRVMVCKRHKGKDLTAKQEVSVQDCLARAISNANGWVQKNQKIVKKTKIMKEFKIK